MMATPARPAPVASAKIVSFRTVLASRREEVEAKPHGDEGFDCRDGALAFDFGRCELEASVLRAEESR